MTTKIHVGDCVEVMRGMAADPRCGSVDMVFADPPYNIGVDYGDGCRDDLTYSRYMDFTESWIVASLGVLHSGQCAGPLWVLISENWADMVGSLLRTRMPRKARIIWRETFAQYNNAVTNFTQEHRHLFYHAHPGATWNPDDIRIPSARMEQGDKRACGPRVPGDVWDVSRVQGNNLSRVDWHPCQLNSLALERIVLCSTNPGDTVLEPFSGSAILGVVCKKLGRNYIGIDSNPDYVAKGLERIANPEPEPVEPDVPGQEVMDFAE